MIHPHTELAFINEEVGHGVVATKFIPAGTITWVLDKLDRTFTPKQFEKMNDLYKEILETYSFRNSSGNLVLCWDHGRFVNHSFKSNCLSTAYDFEIAIRDIHPGEQLTDDYGYLNISTPFKAANEGTQRKMVFPNDLEKYYPVWDKQLKANFSKIPTVDQPLSSLISKKVQAEIDEVLADRKPLASILELYYKSK
ncbi:MAG: SET domain-containing protein [Flavobacteriaceae bacterium]|nr:SET domain-containing protein [Flavobacteriaceae bacterium]